MSLAAEAADPAGAGALSEATLDLLQDCVEAMSLLQGKFCALEVETQIKLDASTRELGAARAALAQAQADTEQSAQRLRACEDRIARLEAATAEAARLHAEELTTARADATTWRMRVETDAMAFDHMTTRLTRLEDGLAAKLDRTMDDLAGSEAENAALRSRVESAQAAADQLKTRLRDVDATIADQRSRISCLQSKLSTATYAMRFESLARQLDPAEADERDILDLQPSAKNLISAA